MKRKRSHESVIAQLHKKTVNNNIRHPITRPCRLLKILGQYGLMASIAQNLFPKDLFSLAATSKSTYKTIFPSKESRTNLFAKMACAGRGVALRRLHHQKSVYFSQYQCVEYVHCQSEAGVESSQSKACDVCLQTTCDECRIHCVYGCIQQLVEAPDELPELSGFALLAPHEMRILTPAHMGLKGTNLSLPYHDKGYLDNPLESTVDAKIECVEALLDFDLGRGPLRLSDSSNTSHPSPVIQAFWNITESRKRWLCEDCYEETCSEQGISGSPHSCCCTLRNAFVDRWLCIPCYQAEQKVLKETFPPTTCNGRASKCQPCGKSLEGAAPTLMCLWCWGIVADATLSVGVLAV